MHGQRCTQAIGSFVALVIILSLIFDEPMLVVPGVMLSLYLLVRAASFSLVIKSLGSGVSVEREVQHHIVRQGATTKVSTLIRYPQLQGVTFTFEDILPAGTVLAEGDTRTQIPRNASGVVELSYRMKLISRGSLMFGGLSVTCADTFLSETVVLSGPKNRTPILHVQPSPTFEERAPSSGYGIHEQEKARPVQGQSIRSFRPFTTGDDERAIDWKLSAKHNRLMLREYMGSTGGVPLIIFDLPSDAAVGDSVLSDRLIAAVDGAIGGAIRDFRRCDVLVISGGNLVRSLVLERNAHPWYHVLNELVPGTGYHPFYRFLTTADLQALHQYAERAAEKMDTRAPDRVFVGRIAELYHATARTSTRTVFEVQLDEAFRGVRERDVLIYTLARGDLSHLHIVMASAWKHRLDAHIRIVTRRVAPPVVVQQLLRLGARTVDVIA